ncbi:MAG: hypothetical protein DRJ09_11120 [Bacteroidetes bacterium]|nr:MAG: hypothetical protein DRJ09_11120 [Bacteroidota bacterium]
MKRYLLLLLVVLSFTGNLYADGLRAYFSYANFDIPYAKPYIETYLTVDGSSVQYVQSENEKWYGKLDIQVVFSKNDSIVNFNKYQLTSPPLDDTALTPLNFLDIQRYILSEGTYFMKLTIKDDNSDKEPFVSTSEITIGFPNDSISISDIELIADYKQTEKKSILSKNGYSILPYVFNYYPESVRKLSFYAEIYHPDTLSNNTPYVLYSYIRPYEIDKKLDKYFQVNRKNPRMVSPLLKSFNISELPSGNYLLVLEARNKDNDLIASKELFFQRYNPTVQFNLNTLLAYNPDNTFAGHISNKDTLVQYIKYTIPVSTDFERKYAESQLASPDLATLQKYFLNFWVTRNKENPEKAWIDYKHLVDYANKKFKTVSLDGYETDRGRVFLKYGQPNVVSENYNEPAAYPYEIWHYYELQGQHDKKFVFYTRDIVTNDFQLIHSDAVGELRNYQWQYIVYKRVMYPGNLADPVSQPNSWGNSSTDYYLQPR